MVVTRRSGCLLSIAVRQKRTSWSRPLALPVPVQAERGAFARGAEFLVRIVDPPIFAVFAAQDLIALLLAALHS